MKGCCVGRRLWPVAGLSLTLVVHGLVLVGTAGSAPLAAQEPIPGLELPADTSTIQAVSLRDGSTLYGRVVDLGPPVQFRLTSGQVIVLEPATIREVRLSRGRVVDGQLWEPDPNPTRLFFAPTARTTPAGSGYFSVFELFIPFLSFSLTDAFMLAGGTPILGGLGGDRPFWIAPKLRVLRTESTQASVGIWSISTGDVDDGIFSLAYGVATFGSLDNAFTLGLGYGLEGTDPADRPVVVAGFESRVGRGMKLVSENWVFPGGVGFLSLGPRFMGERLSADLGVAVLFGEGDSLVFPLVNFLYSW